MKHAPPISAPAGPRSRQAQKIAIWVEAGPGIMLVAATPSSNSDADIQPRRSTQSARSSAMCAGGPPNPVQPIRPHSRAIVRSGTGSRARHPPARRPARSPARRPACRARVAPPSRCLSFKHEKIVQLSLS